MMRIITGKARGVRLDTLEGLTTRPTAERAKEAIFNTLQFEIEGRRVLDLFSGSGQLALEALSRGAKDAVLCDKSPDAVRIIKRNIDKTRLTGARVINGDYLSAVKLLSGEKFDIVFLDPPYAAKLIGSSLDALVRYDLVSDGGAVVCEDEIPEPHEHGGYKLRKHGKYGRIYLTFLEKEIEK